MLLLTFFLKEKGMILFNNKNTYTSKGLNKKKFEDIRTFLKYISMTRKIK